MPAVISLKDLVDEMECVSDTRTACINRRTGELITLSEDDVLREELLTAIHGRGAFRMFRQVVNGRGIQDAWHRFRRDAVEEFAVAWLETNGIGYTRAPGRHEKERA